MPEMRVQMLLQALRPCCCRRQSQHSLNHWHWQACVQSAWQQAWQLWAQPLLVVVVVLVVAMMQQEGARKWEHQVRAAAAAAAAAACCWASWLAGMWA
jgi:hypothetical protein